ncbi:hypothetical protein CXF72_01380 [Psychromonas sp. MB-3u-54]|uniref:hypothetical protein n=1 Tax=Psychromonas sp. MB-3u-54 TaxID=2058319 RepID=UPI000C34BC4E|nr:hypothetical protein [Psychromonas sp. MB-3u-54]PKH04421.1 hypothetical protein CXF72_01380 [Psychromonas sp. MB-3u-54]
MSMTLTRINLETVLNKVASVDDAKGNYLKGKLNETKDQSLGDFATSLAYELSLTLHYERFKSRSLLSQ